MKIRSVLLGTAALFVTGVAANAADAPASKMESACEFGDSYFAIGGGNCLDISGRARFEYAVTSADDKNLLGDNRTDFEKEVDLSGLSANGRIDFTVMSATDMGPLKGFLRVEDTISKAYVSWNGLTAGKTGSFFGFSSGLGADEASHTTGTWDSTVPLLAYTFDAGNGITATVSAEKRSGGAVLAGINNSAFAQGSTVLDANLTNTATADATNTVGTGALTGAATVDNTEAVLAVSTETYKLPDFVADIEITQDWGSAGISGAITGLRVTNPSDATKTVDATGYAIGAGVSVNVPGADGLSLNARGTYGAGATNYVLSKNIGRGTTAVESTAAAAYLVSNADNTSFEVELVTAWDVGVGVGMDISDTMSANLAVSYAQIDQEQAEKVDGTVLDNQLNLSGTLYWTPVSDLTIGLEAFYQKEVANEYQVAEADATGGVIGVVGTAVVTTEQEDATVGGSLTITRTF